MKYQLVKQMPAYKSHKIGNIVPGVDGAVLYPEEDGLGTFAVDDKFMIKHQPQIGGYFVVYEDGYKSWSPAEAFESGYTKLLGTENTITEEKIKSKILSEEFHKMGKKTTICLLTLHNGFEVVGVSACVDPANYDQAIGEKIALENATEKIWELEGYLLQNNL